jgi:DNA-binding transcriptional LysR family regulator
MASALAGLTPPRPNENERKKALEHPGPPWRDWFYASFLKVWIPLGFLIVDSWIVGYWVEAGELIGVLPSLAVAIYLEYLVFMYLWYRPRDDPSHSVRAESRRRWLFPVLFGRWTPEGTRIRAGLPPYGSENVSPGGGPDPTEFF